MGMFATIEGKSFKLVGLVSEIVCSVAKNNGVAVVINHTQAREIYALTRAMLESKGVRVPMNGGEFDRYQFLINCARIGIVQASDGLRLNGEVDWDAPRMDAYYDFMPEDCVYESDVWECVTLAEFMLHLRRWIIGWESEIVFN